ncbi:MAG: hypothetical protein ACK40K_04590, partial [Raineya sp.]
FPSPSEHIQKVIEKACQTEAYKRYQTCEAMKADLLQSFYIITHQEAEKPPTKPLTYVIWITTLALGSVGIWFLIKNFIVVSNQKPKEISFNNNSPLVIKDTIDYNKIAQQKQQEEKEKKEKEKD